MIYSDNNEGQIISSCIHNVLGRILIFLLLLAHFLSHSRYSRFCYFLNFDLHTFEYQTTLVSKKNCIFMAKFGKKKHHIHLKTYLLLYILVWMYIARARIILVWVKNVLAKIHLPHYGFSVRKFVRFFCAYPFVCSSS